MGNYKYDVFFSYSRKDAQNDSLIFDLYEALLKNGLTVWLDTENMNQEDPVFSQTIAEAIKSSERVLLFVGSNFNSSQYVASELKYARTVGRLIFPVLYAVMPDDWDSRQELVPERYRDKHIYDFTELNKDSDRSLLIQRVVDEMKRPIIEGALSANFKNLPQNYLNRDSYICEMERQLFGDNRGVNGNTIGGFYGRAGIGKSVMANAFCRDAEVRRAFRDGIIWLNVKRGGSFGSIYQQLQELCSQNCGFPQVYEEIDIKRAIEAFFESKNYLIVLDDVWEDNTKIIFFFNTIFSKPTSHNKLLITSRSRTVISTFTNPDHIEQLNPEEAKQMLLLEIKHRGDSEKDIEALLSRLKGHTLSLSIVCAMHRDGKSWKRILEIYDQKRAKIERQRPDYEYNDTFSAIAASVESLKDNQSAYYYRLAVFYKNEKFSFFGKEGIPISALTVLWKSIDPTMDSFKAKSLAETFANMSLADYEEDEESARIFLHDLEFEFLHSAVSASKEIDLSDLHKDFVDMYKQITNGDWISFGDDKDYYQRIVYHMFCSEGEYTEEAELLLLNYSWIKKKLSICGCGSLLNDYHFAESHCKTHKDSVAFVHKAVFLSAEFLAVDSRHLPLHFVGRMLGFEDNSDIKSLLNQLYTEEKDFWLRPTARCMSSPYSNLLNQWNVRAGISCASGYHSEKSDKIAAVYNEAGSTIVLFDVSQNESVFSWICANQITCLRIEEQNNRAQIIAADSCGNVCRWTVGNPEPEVIFKDKEARPVAFIEKRSDDYLFISKNGDILNSPGFSNSLSCTVTACCLFENILYLGCSDGTLYTIDLENNPFNMVTLFGQSDLTICNISVCSSNVGIEAVKQNENNREAEVQLIILDRRIPHEKQFANRITIPCGNRFGGGIHFRDDGSIIYTNGIYSFSFDILEGKKSNGYSEKIIAINEHWIKRSLLLGNVLVCCDNYGHICCFDTEVDYIQSFSNFDSFTAKAMIDTECFGTLQTGLRGCSALDSDKIFAPEYRNAFGISQVLYCMALTSNGIVYADEEHGPCLLLVGEKQPIKPSGQHAKPLCAVGYLDGSLIGYEDGKLMRYDQAFNESEYYTFSCGVEIVCSAEETVFCSLGQTVIKIASDSSTQSVSFSEHITHLFATDAHLFVVYGNQRLRCFKVRNMSEVSVKDADKTLFSMDSVAKTLTGAGYVFYISTEGDVYQHRLGDFQLAYQTRHNKKDRKSFCYGNMVIFCDDVGNDNFSLKIQEIGYPTDEVVETINSSVYLSILAYDDYVLTVSQQDDLSVWDMKTRTLLRRINTDSLLRSIAVVNDYIAFVSGSHIFWLKIENIDKLKGLRPQL